MTRFYRWTAQAGLAFCLLLAGCGAPDAAGDAVPVALPALEPTTHPSPVELAQPCEREPGQPAATGEPAGIEARYDGDENRIILSAGTGVTLPALSAALDNPEVLRETAPGEWLLGADLDVMPGADLQIGGPEARWLKLRSDDELYVAVRAFGGDLTIEDACITSWDEGSGQVDENYDNGRGFLLARDGSQMNIRRSELRYLGYYNNEAYGLSWRLEGTSGGIYESVVSHNFYGMYSFEASDLVIAGNEFHHNVLYGIDPHTRSHRLLIEDNIVHNNGKHGIILADECQDSVIRNNVVYNNLHHGIVLYQRSDRNIIEGNESYNNGAQGININDASDNVVRNNTVYENLETGIGVGKGSANNSVVENQVRANGEDGVSLYSEAASTEIRANTISDNRRYGVHVNSNGGFTLAGNEIFGNEVGLVLKGGATAAAGDNRIYDNRDGDVRNG